MCFDFSWPHVRLSRQERRAVAGAVLLDLAVSSLFAWDVFVPSLSRQLAVPDESLAIVFSVGLAAFTTGVLAGGRAADRLPPRRLALGTAVGATAGLLGAAFAGSVAAVVVSFGVLLGLATGIGYATAVRVAGVITVNRGLVMGLVVSAYAAGTVVIAPAAEVLLSHVGRVATLCVLGVITAIALVLAATMLPAQAPVRRHSSRRGPVYSATTVRLWIVFGLGSAPCLAAFAHAGQLIHGPRVGATAVSLLSAGNLLGRLVAGPVSDRVGRSLSLHVNAAALVVACALLATVDNRAVALAVLLMLGTQYGALSALTPATTADVVPPDRLGATYGAIFTGWGLGGLCAPLVAAAAAAHLGWDQTFLVFLAPAVTAWVALSLPRTIHTAPTTQLHQPDSKPSRQGGRPDN